MSLHQLSLHHDICGNRTLSVGSIITSNQGFIVCSGHIVIREVGVFTEKVGGSTGYLVKRLIGSFRRSL